MAPNERDDMQDKRIAEIAASLRDAGHQPMRDTLDNGDIKITVPGQPIKAIVHTDGSVTRTWQDGTEGFESIAAR